MIRRSCPYAYCCKVPIGVGSKPSEISEKMENGSRSAVRVCQVFGDAFVDKNQNILYVVPIHVATIYLLYLFAT